MNSLACPEFWRPAAGSHPCAVNPRTTCKVKVALDTAQSLIFHCSFTRCSCIAGVERPSKPKAINWAFPGRRSLVLPPAFASKHPGLSGTLTHLDETLPPFQGPNAVAPSQQEHMGDYGNQKPSGRECQTLKKALGGQTRQATWTLPIGSYMRKQARFYAQAKNGNVYYREHSPPERRKAGVSAIFKARLYAALYKEVENLSPWDSAIRILRRWLQGHAQRRVYYVDFKCSQVNNINLQGRNTFSGHLIAKIPT
ncbi:hypothetical protein STEG23_026878 [Scotinomys teguina]